MNQGRNAQRAHRHTALVQARNAWSGVLVCFIGWPMATCASEWAGVIYNQWSFHGGSVYYGSIWDDACPTTCGTAASAWMKWEDRS